MKKQFFGFFSLLLIHPSLAEPIFFWSIEKERKTSYILGTIHAGISLEELPCSSKITEKLRQSQMVFLEIVGETQLNPEEQRIILTAPQVERDKILNRLSPKDRDMFFDRIKSFKELIIKPQVHRMISRELKQEIGQVLYRGPESFEDLSQKAQKFLIAHGVDTEGNYADYWYDLFALAYYEAIFSFPSLDSEIKKMVLSFKIPLRALDNQLSELVPSHKESNRAVYLTNREDIEVLIDKFYSILVVNTKKSILEAVDLYKKGIVYFDITEEETVTRNRNQIWLEKINAIYQNTEIPSIFVVAGARHFVGPGNLIDMLQLEGFKTHLMTCEAGALAPSIN